MSTNTFERKFFISDKGGLGHGMQTQTPRQVPRTILPTGNNSSDRWFSKLETANSILADLPRKEAEELRPQFESVFCESENVLSTAGEPVNYVYFPLDAVISQVASMEDGKIVTVRLVGSEGVLGFRAMAGARTASYTAVATIPGTCLRIKKEAIRPVFRQGGALQARILRYAVHAMEELSQTAACNRLHLLKQRLNRWLLLLQKSTGRNQFAITHECLSRMLGCPRSEITLAAGTLRKCGLIEYGRGLLKIVDKPGLESAACECHRIDEEYGLSDQRKPPPAAKTESRSEGIRAISRA